MKSLHITDACQVQALRVGWDDIKPCEHAMNTSLSHEIADDAPINWPLIE
jgi:hypothetical protein